MIPAKNTSMLQNPKAALYYPRGNVNAESDIINPDIQQNPDDDSTKAKKKKTVVILKDLSGK